jgi:coenzyme F420-reducing hydrogenase delta subunit
MYTSIYCFFSSAYGLILTQDLNFSDSIRLELLKKAEKELGVEEENLAFWLDAFKMEKLQKEIMPHLMNDIGQKLW